MGKVLIYDPTSSNDNQVKQVNAKLPDLRGKVIGFEVGWPRFAKFMDRVEELLRERYEIADVIRVPARSATAHGGRKGEEARNWDNFKATIDCAILGLGT